MDNLISVIIPIWKPKLSYLKKCIDSIINQTYANLEIILVYRCDDSFDQEFDSFISKISDERIVVIKNKKKGIGNALNQGLEVSNGEFIARMDADDICMINRFEKQIQFLSKNEIDVVGSWAYYITNDGNRIKELRLPSTHDKIRKQILFFNPILHPSVLIRKKMIDEIGNYDEKLVSAEDYELWCRAISKGFKFYNIPEFLIELRGYSKSATRGDGWKIHRKYVHMVQKLALKKYGFQKPLDIIYYVIGSLILLISPKTEKIIKSILRI